MPRNQWLVTFILMGVTSSAYPYTPESREVQQMISKSVRYLENVPASDLGRDCLVALALKKVEALKKSDKSTSHPKIQSAIQQIQRHAAELTGDQKVHRTYGQSCALIFLCQFKDPKHRPSVEKLTTALLKWQKSNGAWGYENEPVGDTSQTVFAVMALWEAKQQIDVPDDAFAAALNWLLQTQDVSGGFAYKGEVPDRGEGHRLRQPNPYPCATAAGMGAIYICAKALKLEVAIIPGGPHDDMVPPALQFVAVIDHDGNRISDAPGRVNHVFLTRALTDGNRWFDRHYSIAPTNWFSESVPWNYYYLYTLERFKTFQTKPSDSRKPRRLPGMTRASAT